MAWRVLVVLLVQIYVAFSRLQVGQGKVVGTADFGIFTKSEGSFEAAFWVYGSKSEVSGVVDLVTSSCEDIDGCDSNQRYTFNVATGGAQTGSCAHPNTPTTAPSVSNQSTLAIGTAHGPSPSTAPSTGKETTASKSSQSTVAFAVWVILLLLVTSCREGFHIQPALAVAAVSLSFILAAAVAISATMEGVFDIIAGVHPGGREGIGGACLTLNESGAFSGSVGSWFGLSAVGTFQGRIMELTPLDVTNPLRSLNISRGQWTSVSDDDLLNESGSWDIQSMVSSDNGPPWMSCDNEACLPQGVCYLMTSGGSMDLWLRSEWRSGNKTGQSLSVRRYSDSQCNNLIGRERFYSCFIGSSRTCCTADCCNGSLRQSLHEWIPCAAM